MAVLHMIAASTSTSNKVMPPSRTRGEHSQAKASTSKQPHALKHGKRRKVDQEEPAGPPGVQKTKASIRQTRRLLAKDKLAADVRVETERRLKALEAELSQAELARKERTIALRYHKVKFFERKKVCRRLKQTQTHLESSQKDSEKKKLQSQLYELRVDLNYILHYPATKKYISLFPPEARNGEGHPEAVVSVSAPDAQKTEMEREQLRLWVRGQMKQGQLSAEPELHLETRIHREPSRSTTWTKSSKKTVTEKSAEKQDDVEDDAFFGEDGEDSE